jgi:hypothetical protein
VTKLDLSLLLKRVLNIKIQRAGPRMHDVCIELLLTSDLGVSPSDGAPNGQHNSTIAPQADMM